MFRSAVWQLVHGQSGGMPWIRIKDRRPFLRSGEIREIFKRHRVAFDERSDALQLQGASLDVTSPRAKAPGLFCLTAPRS